MSVEKGGYLESHLEKKALPPEDQIRTYESHQRLSKPLDKVDYKDRGDISLEKDNVVISFSYRSLKPEDVSGLNQEFLQERQMDVNQLRLLDDVSIGKKDDSKTINVQEDLPIGYKIIFIPKDKTIFGGNADVEYKTIYIWGSLARPKIILNLLHEIGHSIDYEKIEEKKDKEYFINSYKAMNRANDQNPTKKDLEEVLKRERNAWAFTLSKIKPVLGRDGLSKDDVRSFIHSALSGYSDIIRQRIELGLYDPELRNAP